MVLKFKTKKIFFVKMYDVDQGRQFHTLVRASSPESAESHMQRLPTDPGHPGAQIISVRRAKREEIDREGEHAGILESE